jgi:cytochrome c-type biogenesis protein CcmH
VRSLLAALLVFSLAGPGLAKQAARVAEDPALEARAMAIAENLRCLVCQNQTIADSRADLAVDLKTQIREKLKAGMSDGAILDFMVARYGDFVLYRPPLKASTVLLWFGPFALLLGAFAFLLFQLRRRSKAEQRDPPLDEAARARARELLGSSREQT